MFNNGESVYKVKFDDKLGVFFTPEEFPELLTNKDDVSDILQGAIDRLIKEQCYGNLYIPEGTYPLKKTVKIPPAVRLIGYGEKRPLFLLPADAEGYDGNGENRTEFSQESFWDAYPGAAYMLWFIGERDTQKPEPRDANAGTFYSALSNIDFKIEGTHKGAICIRAHFAQHGFINHCHFDLGDGLAGLFDVGNEMEDLSFQGGDYGIICRMTSPGWPFALLDSQFDGQKECAILTTMTGFNGFRLKISNTKKAFDLYRKNTWEKLYLEDCLFENISDEAISFYCDTAIIQQTNIKNLYCSNVPTLIRGMESGYVLKVDDENYVVKDYTYGYTATDEKENANKGVFSGTVDAEKQNSFNGAEATIKESKQIQPLLNKPCLPDSDIPALPETSEWVSVAKYGAVGDGETDDTKALQAAFDNEKVLFVPQGIYKLSDTLFINNDTVVIGLNPVTTQFVIVDDEDNFAGFGPVKPLVETAQGIRVIFNGIGIDTAGKNPRACGIKWRAGRNSYMNDVKFMGGHGLMYRDGHNPFTTLYNISRTGDYNPDRVWDYQYSSLWITDNGGGIFKDIWSASPYAEAGIAITYTDTPGRMYAISLEHHVRSEIKLNHVSNFSLYALQTEEELAEGQECLPMELVSCKNIEIVSYFLFRVVAVNMVYDCGIKVWDSENITFKNLHNKAQMQYTFTISLKDETTGFFAKSPEYARLFISGGGATAEPKKLGDFKVIAEGFNFAQGATLDKRGNLYWCDKHEKRIFKYDSTYGTVIPFLDIHYTPAALAIDEDNHMLVAVDYSELKNHKDGDIFQSHDLSNFHPFFSWFYRRYEKMYSVDINRPYDTMVALEKTSKLPESIEYFVRPQELDYPGMFEMVTAKDVKEYYIAPDGKTAVEATIDLARSLKLGKIKVNEEALLVDDALRRTFSYDVSLGGNYKNGKVVATKGQYAAWKSQRGIIWTVDDKLYGFFNGECVAEHEVPYDAYGIVGNDKEFFIIGRHGIYL